MNEDFERLQKNTSQSPLLYQLKQKTRTIWGLIAAVCALAMAYALYTEHLGGLEPCNLCMLQRGSMITLGVIALLAFLHNPAKTGQIVYAILADLAALSGVILAGRHVWLQHLPEDKVPACGPPFDYLVSQFPITEVIQEIFSGSGDCAKVQWEFIGFSMPEILLGLFGVLLMSTQLLAILAISNTPSDKNK